MHFVHVIKYLSIYLSIYLSKSSKNNGQKIAWTRLGPIFAIYKMYIILWNWYFSCIIRIELHTYECKSIMVLVIGVIKLALERVCDVYNEERRKMIALLRSLIKVNCSTWVNQLEAFKSALQRERVIFN